MQDNVESRFPCLLSEQWETLGGEDGSGLGRAFSHEQKGLAAEDGESPTAGDIMIQESQGGAVDAGEGSGDGMM